MSVTSWRRGKRSGQSAARSGTLAAQSGPPSAAHPPRHLLQRRRVLALVFARPRGRRPAAVAATATLAAAPAAVAIVVWFAPTAATTITAAVVADRPAAAVCGGGLRSDKVRITPKSIPISSDFNAFRSPLVTLFLSGCVLCEA